MPNDSPIALSRRRFTMEDQRAFALLSGDVNPIHMDQVAARRSVVGAVVVHGVHTVSWSLEVLAKSEFNPGRLRGIDVLFSKPVYLGDEVTLTLQSKTADKLKLTAMVGDKSVASISCDCRPGAGLPHCPSETADPLPAPTTEPEDLALETVLGKTGLVDFAAPLQDFATAFPDAAALVGAARLRGLAACSRLVGMNCPGLRSVFSRLTLDWTDGDAAAPIAYEAVQVNTRYNIVRMQVAGAGLTGRIEAFAPPKPPRQLTLGDLTGLVAPDEFAHQTALVIGGSRGLGELTAKAIAAGGGRVLITYAIGGADAARVAEDIRAGGGRADILPYDVTQPASTQLAGLNGSIPTHVYYFATCPIFQAKTKAFDPAILDRFLAYYVCGFYELCLGLWQAGMKNAAVFYPSSVALETRPVELTEYAMAKAAGEALCTDIPRLLPGISVIQQRLPRLPTDQTLVVTPQELPNAIDYILPMVRQIN